jgi:hypothetical protein
MVRPGQPEIRNTDSRKKIVGRIIRLKSLPFRVIENVVEHKVYCGRVNSRLGFRKIRAA